MKEIRRFRQVGDRRYRESHAILYEQFSVGDIIEHRPGRTITESECITQSMQTLNVHPLHIDAEYARYTEFKQTVISSLVTLSVVGGLSTLGTSCGAIANLGWENIRLMAPVFPGTTLYAESTIVGKRLSESRPGLGIVTFTTRGHTRDNTTVLEFTRSALIPTEEWMERHSIDPYY